jgi:hypothetical protein
MGGGETSAEIRQVEPIDGGQSTVKDFSRKVRNVTRLLMYRNV